MATLAVEAVTKSFGNTHVLKGIDLQVDEGEMIVIVGASGCGKSTLLRIVSGLETATTGSIRIAGADVTRLEPKDRDVAMVFQNYALYPHMSVFDNMAYGLKIRGLPGAEIRRRVDEAAALLEIGQLLQRRPKQLSGGQRQRVAMGRAIVREPKLFLFDEPLSNLDAKLRVTMRAEIKRLQRRLGVTSLYVTHDQVEAMTLGDRLVVMHEGRAEQVASPMEIWSRPANTFVAGFIGAPAMNFLEGELAGNGDEIRLKAGLSVHLLDGPRPGGAGRPVTVGIRPEHFVPTTDGSGLDVEIDLVEPLGAESLVHGRLRTREAVTLKLTDSAPLPGSLLRVTAHPLHLHAFASDSGVRLDPLVGAARRASLPVA